MKAKLRKIFCSTQEGVGVVEVILILVILIGLVLIFRQQIFGILQSAFGAIGSNASKINADPAGFPTPIGG